MIYDEISYIRSKLADEESKKIFDARLQFAIDKDVSAFFQNTKGDKCFREYNLSGIGERFESFFEENKNKKIIIYGAGYFGKLDKDILEVCGYSVFAYGDSNCEMWGKEIKGIKVLNDSEIVKLKDEAVFVIGGGTINAIGIFRKLAYWLNIEKEKIYIPWFDTLGAICGQQYFDFFESCADEVFVDVGAYNGQTSVEFTRWCPDYKDIYIFEADKKVETVIRKTMKDEGISKYHLIMKGVSDSERSASLFYDLNCDGGNKISSNGDVLVELVSLDKIVNDKVTFIKMDIEGEERNALLGAENLIKTYKPKLAISVYHKSDDFFKIPELLLELNQEYKFALRHYTSFDCETILYAW